MRRAIIQIFTGNLLSKALGLIREVLTAALFGTGQAVGAFRVAQSGTLAPVNFFTSDSLNSAFIPQYKKFRAVSFNKAQTFFWSLTAIFCLLAILIGAFLWLSASPWVNVLAPGLESETAMLAISLLKIMALGVPFYLLSAILMFLGMANDDFVPMAIRPVVQNLGMIVGALLAFALHDILFLAWGFTVSYIVFATWLMFRCFQLGFLGMPNIWAWPNVREVLHAFWLTLRPLLLLPVMLRCRLHL
jgi:putative peptidoglycan lipid II flippase